MNPSLVGSELCIRDSFFSKSKNNTELVEYAKVKSQITLLQNTMVNLLDQNRNIMEGLKLSETATTNQITAAKVLVDLANKAGFNVALAGIVFDGNSSYLIKGEALSDKDVINYLTRIRDVPIFESVILEKSFIALEGTNIKSFVIKIEVKKELMNAKNLQEVLADDNDIEGNDS